MAGDGARSRPDDVVVRLGGVPSLLELRILLARAEFGSTFHVRRVPVARLVFVGGALLAISVAGAIGSISVPRIEGTIR